MFSQLNQNVLKFLFLYLSKSVTLETDTGPFEGQSVKAETCTIMLSFDTNNKGTVPISMLHIKELISGCL